MKVQSCDSALEEIIGVIGQPGFPAHVGQALSELICFDLVAVVAHEKGHTPTILFQNFDQAGCRAGIELYARATHRINPMLAKWQHVGVWRASEFAGAFVPGPAASDVISTTEEELGFRTIGWPAKQEEIGFCIDANYGFIEIGLYRKRGRYVASAKAIAMLAALRRPVAAAFRRHASLTDSRLRGNPSGAETLTARERDICDLMLQGCSSEAIALRLSISRHTVKDHRKHIFAKLGISSLAELFARAH